MRSKILYSSGHILDGFKLFQWNQSSDQVNPWMKELRDNTSRKGGLPTLPGLYRSTIQPSRRGFYRIHVCEGEITGDNIYRCQSVCPVVLKDFEFLKKI
jgi:hypothetical protein